MTALLAIGDFVGFVEKPAAAPKPVAACHYMLKLHPNYERKAERQLLEKGIDVYVPKQSQRIRTTSNRYRWRDMPVFPGLLFVADFDANLSRLKKIADGIGGFVKYSNEALRVSPYWMERIRAFETKLQNLPPQTTFNVGQKVRFVGGPWDMWEGEVFRLDARDRVVVLIQALIGEVRVEADASQVEAV